MISHTTTLRVRYADTDKMGVVYYAKYFEYFEVARTEMLRALGLPYAELEAIGFGLPVIAASARYFKGAKYDDALHVRAEMSAEPGTRLHITYQISHSNTSELLAEGETTLVFIDIVSGRPTRPPKIYLEALEKMNV